MKLRKIGIAIYLLLFFFSIFFMGTVLSFDSHTVLIDNGGYDPNLEYTYSYVVYDFDADLTYWVSVPGDIDLELTLINNMNYMSFDNVGLEVYVYEWFFSLGEWVHTKTVTLHFGNIGGGVTKTATLSTTTVYVISSTAEVKCEINTEGLTYGRAYDTLTDEVVTSSSSSTPAYNPNYSGNNYDGSSYLGGIILLGGLAIVGGYILKNRSKKEERPYFREAPVQNYQIREVGSPLRSSVAYCPQCGTVIIRNELLQFKCTVCGNVFQDTRK